MNPSSFNPQVFYAAQGQISDPGGYARLLDELPSALPELVSVIQGLMLHVYWADRMEISLNRMRKQEVNLRTVGDRLARIIELDEASLLTSRPLSKQTVGTCRDFALLLTSILRHQGVPARARAGFGTYFRRGRFEDHWVCETWQADAQRWVMVDPQLDALQQEALGIDFDPLDVPDTRLVTGGRAWQLCRAGEANPRNFGIFRMKGLDFVKGNLIRDFLALNEIETLPWDNFQLIGKPFRDMRREEKALMDRLAQISSGEDRDFLLVRAAFAANKTVLLPRYFLGVA